MPRPSRRTKSPRSQRPRRSRWRWRRRWHLEQGAKWPATSFGMPQLTDVHRVRFWVASPRSAFSPCAYAAFRPIADLGSVCFSARRGHRASPTSLQNRKATGERRKGSNAGSMHGSRLGGFTAGSLTATCLHPGQLQCAFGSAGLTCHACTHVASKSGRNSHVLASVGASAGALGRTPGETSAATTWSYARAADVLL